MIPEMKDVEKFMSRLGETDSIWSVFRNEESFIERLHQSFDWIGRIFLFTTEHEIPIEWHSIPECDDLFRRSIRDSLDAFLVWYDGPASNEYTPAVAAFEQLRAVLATAESIAMEHKVLEKSPDCLNTLKRLQRDIDEIVGHINDKMREVAGPRPNRAGSGDQKYDRILALLEQLKAVAASTGSKVDALYEARREKEAKISEQKERERQREAKRLEVQAEAQALKDKANKAKQDENARAEAFAHGVY